jgi:hypothetical protein
VISWNTYNPILLPGEPGYDKTNNQLRIGDGVTGWTSIAPLGTAKTYLYNVGPITIPSTESPLPSNTETVVNITQPLPDSVYNGSIPVTGTVGIQLIFDSVTNGVPVPLQISVYPTTDIGAPIKSSATILVPSAGKIFSHVTIPVVYDGVSGNISRSFTCSLTPLDDDFSFSTSISIEFTYNLTTTGSFVNLN